MLWYRSGGGGLCLQELLVSHFAHRRWIQKNSTAVHLVNVLPIHTMLNVLMGSLLLRWMGFEWLFHLNQAPWESILLFRKCCHTQMFLRACVKALAFFINFIHIVSTLDTWLHIICIFDLDNKEIKLNTNDNISFIIKFTKHISFFQGVGAPQVLNPETEVWLLAWRIGL